MIASLSAPTSEDPGPLSELGLDLGKPPGEVTGFKHVQRQGGDTLHDDPILALAVVVQILVLTGAQTVAVVVVRRVAFSPETRSASDIFQRHVSTERRSSAHSWLSVVKTGPSLELARRRYMMVEQSTQREQTERTIVCLVPKMQLFEEKKR